MPRRTAGTVQTFIYIDTICACTNITIFTIAFKWESCRSEFCWTDFSFSIAKSIPILDFPNIERILIPIFLPITEPESHSDCLFWVILNKLYSITYTWWEDSFPAIIINVIYTCTGISVVCKTNKWASALVRAKCIDALNDGPILSSIFNNFFITTWK